MSGTLATLIVDALPRLRWNTESVAEASRTPSDILAIGERVAQALRIRKATAAEAVIVRIGNRPSDLGALLGVWQAGAVAVPIHVTAVAATAAALLDATRARFLVDGDRLEICGAAPPP